MSSSYASSCCVSSPTAVRRVLQVIDNNFYPVEEALRSNMRHRPVGMGVQGLADTFFMLRMPYDSPEAAALNRDIFETIYFAALTGWHPRLPLASRALLVWRRGSHHCRVSLVHAASCELAKVLGPYESYPGSPVSRGTHPCPRRLHVRPHTSVGRVLHRCLVCL